MTRATGLLLAIPLAALLSPARAGGPVDLSYRYDLADFTGTIPYSDARVVVDPPRREVYALYGNQVRVFNDTGMEIYRFDWDLSLGRIADLAVEKGGDMLLLVYPYGGDRPTGWSLVRADYRGRPIGEIPLESSEETEGLLPNRLLLRGGGIWLVGLGQMRAASWDSGGKLDRTFDLAALAALSDEDRGNAEVSGLDVAEDGTLVFAIPVQFQVHVVDAEGKGRAFGRSGSGAGNFGVLGDVALDRDGNIFLSDRQRSVVLVFDRDLRFLRETGRIATREWLVRPGNLALDPAGRLYVSQVANRGVAVFTIEGAP